MREETLMLLTALAVFGLVSHHALNTANRDEVHHTVEVDTEKVNFLFDVPRKGILTGKRIDKGFAINTEIDGLYLDMHLQFNDDKSSTAYSILIFQNENASRHEKTGNQSGSVLKTVWDVCNATANWAWNRATRAGNMCLSCVLNIIDKVYTGVQCLVICVANWTLDGVEWTCDSVTCLEKWTWDAFVHLKEWAWERAVRLTGCIWYKGTWLAEGIWYGVSRMAGRVWEIAAWPGNVLTEFYVGYLKSHVTRIMTLLAGLTWQDALNLIVVNFCVLFIYLIKCAVDIIRRRRQAQLEKEAADRLAAAAAAAKKKRQQALNIRNRCNKKKCL